MEGRNSVLQELQHSDCPIASLDCNSQIADLEQAGVEVEVDNSAHFVHCHKTEQMVQLELVDSLAPEDLESRLVMGCFVQSSPCLKEVPSLAVEVSTVV